MPTKTTKTKQGGCLSFDQLAVLLDLKHEHEQLIIEKTKLGTMQDDGPVECFHLAHAVLSLSHRGYHAKVRADVTEMARWIEQTIERRLTDVEQQMTDLGVTNITREPPQQHIDLDEIPF